MHVRTLKAFTLLELLVGMILSGIVLTATFTAYRLVTHQYETYCDKSRSIAEISFFSSRLEADFANANELTFIAENKIQLQAEKRLTQYRFSEKYILRDDPGRTDTFYVSVSSTTAYHRSEKISTANSLLDELHITIAYEGKTQEKIYRSTKDPKAEIEREAIDLNEYGH